MIKRASEGNATQTNRLSLAGLSLDPDDIRTSMNTNTAKGAGVRTGTDITSDHTAYQCYSIHTFGSEVGVLIYVEAIYNQA